MVRDVVLRYLRRWWVLLACAAFGLAITLGVSWAGATRYPFSAPEFTEARTLWPAPTPANWRGEQPHHWSVERGTTHEISVFIQVARTEQYSERGEPYFRRRIAIVGRFGWPMRALGWAKLSETDDRLFNNATKAVQPDGLFWTGLDAEAVPGLRKLAHNRTLPLRPLAPGFIVDALLFGGTLFVLAGSMVTWRAWLRRRRGRCALCGYALAGMARCSECGAVIDRAALTRAEDLQA